MEAGDGSLGCPATSICVPYPQLQGYSNLLGNYKDFFISYVLDMTLDNNMFKHLDHRASLDPARFKPTAVMAICVGSECTDIWASCKNRFDVLTIKEKQKFVKKGTKTVEVWKQASGQFCSYDVIVIIVMFYPWFMSCSVSSSHIRTWMASPFRIQWNMSSILMIHF